MVRGDKRKGAKTKPAGEAAEVEEDGSQRRPQKQNRRQKREKLIKKLSAKKPAPINKSSGIQKKRRRKESEVLNNLGNLADSLQLGGKSQKTNKTAPSLGTSVNTLKVRRLITEKETVRLQQVLKHPEYTSNPIAAITNHLTATLPPPPVPKRSKEDERQRQKEKKKRKKLLNRDNAMMS